MEFTFFIKAVEFLLKQGVNPNDFEENLGEPIMNQHFTTQEILSYLQLLLNYGWQPAPYTYFITLTCQSEIAEFLLKNGADPNIDDCTNLRDLIGLAFGDKSHHRQADYEQDMQIIDLFFQAGANPDESILEALNDENIGDGIFVNEITNERLLRNLENYC